MNQTLMEIWTVCRSIGGSAWHAIHQYSTVFLVIIASLLLVISFAVYRLATPPDRVVLLTGPTAGGGERLGAAISARLEAPPFWDLRQRRLELVVRPSEGFEDNRRRIDRDTTGKLIAFAQDGFEPTPNVQVLLPLEENFVHIIVSRKFYDAAKEVFDQVNRTKPTHDAAGQDRRGSESLRLFEHLVPVLRRVEGERSSPELNEQARNLFATHAYHRAFLGPELSGTRQTAKLILDHYGVPSPSIDCHQEYDWREMYAALVDERIHLAFFTTEPGSKVVQNLANHGGFHLLGLGNPDGICQFKSHVFPREFQSDAYGALTGQSDFLRGPVRTIATRRVIVCSRAMSTPNAYWLTNRLREAIHHEVPTIHWENSPEQPVKTANLTYQFHPGAVYVRKDSMWYSYVPSSLWPVVLLLVLVVLKGIDQLVSPSKGNAASDDGDDNRPITEINRLSANGRPSEGNADMLLNGHSGSDDGASRDVSALHLGNGRMKDGEHVNVGSATYHLLYHDVDRANRELAGLPRKLSRKTLEEWHVRAGALWKAISLAHCEGHLTDEQRDSLMEGMREIECTLAQSRHGRAASKPHAIEM